MSDRLECGGELSDETRIDLVGLGELADGAGEAADLQRRDDDDGELVGERGVHEGPLEASGGLDDDAIDTVAAERTNQGSDRPFFVGNAECAVAFEQMDIELLFADIDADVDGGSLLCHEHSNLLNSGSGPIRLFEMS